jgi:GT2 family glycosyltransferase
VRDITVVVCTHRLGRWPWLLECLASLERQILQPLEVIVVVDGSPEIRARLDARSGPEMTLSTPAPSGLSAARNLGLAHASGRYVAFLDDDAVAEESWLKALRTVLMDETVAGAGGVSLPNWEGQHPRWLPDELLWTLGCSYRGMPVTKAEVRNVYGGSACFQRDIFNRFGGFNLGLGRMANGLAGCEETELCLRVRGQSPELRFVHDPSAVIYHRVPRDRQRIRYLLSRCSAEGHSKAILLAISYRDNAYPLAREASYLTRTVPSGIASGIAQFIRGDGWALARAIVLIFAVLCTISAYEITRIRNLFGRGRPELLTERVLVDRETG